MLWNVLETHQKLLNDRVAFCDEKHTVTHGQLIDVIGKYSKHLLEVGVKPEDTVIVMLGNSVEFIISILSIHRIGAISALVDYRIRKNELDHIVINTNAKFIITDKSVDTSNQVNYLDLPNLDDTHFHETRNFLRANNSHLLMHTSGVSGKPKIVDKTWGNILADGFNFANSAEYSSNDNILCSTSLHHSYSISTCLAPALISGASLYLIPVPTVPRRVIDQICHRKITILQAVPLMYSLIIQLTADKVTDHTLRLCLAAGEPLREITAEKFYNIFDIPITTHYGTTEAGAITLNTDHTANSVGKPVANVKVKIIDSAGNELPPEAFGELIVYSQAVSEGYWGNEELTKLRFQDKWFYTGDIATRSTEGNIRLCGRMNEIINVAGNKIDPVEVENVIAQYPGIEQSLVIGIESEITGEEVIAIVVANREIDQAKLQAFLSTKLSSYKLPKNIFLAKELPRSDSGKLLRKMTVLPQLKQ